MEVQHQVKRTLRAPEALVRVRALLAEPEVVHRSALAERVCAEFGFFRCPRARPAQQLSQSAA